MNDNTESFAGFVYHYPSGKRLDLSDLSDSQRLAKINDEIKSGGKGGCLSIGFIKRGFCESFLMPDWIIHFVSENRCALEVTIYEGD